MILNNSFASSIDSITSPILMLPKAEIAQGIDEDIKIILETLYHKNYIEKYPEDLQYSLNKSCDITFLPNSGLKSISEVIRYNDDPAEVIDKLLDTIAKRARTIIITKIDCEGSDIIEFKAKAICLISKLIIIDERIAFQATQKTNFVDKIDKLAKKICKKKYISIGLVFGYQFGDNLHLSNLSKDIRTTPPHPDDVKYRPDDILDPNNPDNYLIVHNNPQLSLKHRINLAAKISFWGLLHIEIQTSQLNESDIIENENYFRKSYIKEGASGGDALIFYSLKSKNRSLFSRSSFSIPIYLAYPIRNLSKNKDIILEFLGGTNLLLPKKISVEAAKGWHRFNERQIQEQINIGKIKETNYFLGVGLENVFKESMKLGVKILLTYKEYQKDFGNSISVERSDEITPSFHVYFTHSIAFLNL
ncbi:MAG: hypothetical protein GF353_00615 [Candidatus Lokiarchaeota archaeon]|nr:hypothetical protein [Candidatus Lokiarchaeota archaeon]